MAPEEQDARLDAVPEFKALLYEHACEGFYAAPEYGGNRDLAGWRLADWAGDVAPSGWTADEVSSATDDMTRTTTSTPSTPSSSGPAPAARQRRRC